MSRASVGTSDSSPTTSFAHNALGQRVFKMAPLFPIQGARRMSSLPSGQEMDTRHKHS